MANFSFQRFSFHLFRIDARSKKPSPNLSTLASPLAKTFGVLIPTFFVKTFDRMK